MQKRREGSKSRVKIMAEELMKKEAGRGAGSGKLLGGERAGGQPELETQPWGETLRADSGGRGFHMPGGGEPGTDGEVVSTQSDVRGTSEKRQRMETQGEASMREVRRVL